MKWFIEREQVSWLHFHVCRLLFWRFQLQRGPFGNRTINCLERRARKEGK
jgi:hypothetical protein